MKKTITKDIISLVQNTYNEQAKKSDNNLCVPFEIHNGTAIAVGLVRVVNNGKDTYLRLDDEAGKTYMKAWNEDVGKLYSRDCKRCVADGKYFTFSTNHFRALLRRISDEELPEMQEKEFDHVTLGDFHYTIIKLIGTGEWAAFSNYEKPDDIPATEEDPDEEYTLEEEPEPESLSLFE